MNVSSDLYFPGLEGVVAAETRLSMVDGQAGELIIGGYALEKIAAKAAYEEVVYLLWFGALPNATQLADFQRELAALRLLPKASENLLRAAASDNIPVMDALLMAGSTTRLGAPVEPLAMSKTLLARLPTIVAAYWRLLQGQELVTPHDSLGHAANYLYMLTGEIPSEESARGMETYLNTVVDHGLNASTFTARVIISTQSDVVSAVVGALGALKGPLHGGAPGPALDTVFEIGEASNAEPVLRSKLDAGERLMGFGHRVYKVRDPRAEVLSAAAERLFRSDGDVALYELARRVEDTAVQLLEEYKPGRNLQTNVEFYTALLLDGLGLSTDLFTPTFAISRAGGWIAHCFEQTAANRLIRPKAAYIGERDLRWTPIEQRLN